MKDQVNPPRSPDTKSSSLPIHKADYSHSLSPMKTFMIERQHRKQLQGLNDYVVPGANGRHLTFSKGSAADPTSKSETRHNTYTLQSQTEGNISSLQTNSQTANQFNSAESFLN